MQQINLLSADLAVRSEPLQARHLLVLWAGVAAVLVGVSGWQGLSLWHLKAGMAATQSEIADLVAANAQQRLQQVDPNALRGEVSELRDQQLVQGALVDQLRRQQSKGGFSIYLKGLAEARVEGLWLTNIHLGDDSANPSVANRLTIKGSTMKPQAVPKLLQNLAELPPFQGQRFQQIELLSSPESELVEFVIASPEAEAKRGISG